MILVDTNNLLYRAYHAASELRTSDGKPSGLMYVGLNMLTVFPDLFPKQSILFLRDSPPYWRKTIYPGYKQRSQEQEQDRSAIYSQLDRFYWLLDQMGFQQMFVPGLEADDLAGIMSTMAIRNKRESVILVSVDKDWLQLLQPGVTQLKNWKGKKQTDVWDEKRLLEEKGVAPRYWPMYLAMLGDESDRIPKALGIGRGPAYALKVLNGKANLNGHEQRQFELNIKLTTVLREYDVNKLKAGITTSKRSKAGFEALEQVIQEYEMYTIWGERQKLWELGGWK